MMQIGAAPGPADGDFRLPRGCPGWKIATRLAGLLLARGGYAEMGEVRGIGEQVLSNPGSIVRRGASKGRRSTAVAGDAIKAMEREGLVRRTSDGVTADDLADLAAWLADELEAFQYADGPAHPRRPA